MITWLEEQKHEQWEPFLLFLWSPTAHHIPEKHNELQRKGSKVRAKKDSNKKHLDTVWYLMERWCTERMLRSSMEVFCWRILFLKVVNGLNLLHDVSDFVLFTVQDDASLLTDLQVLENRRNREVFHFLLHTKHYTLHTTHCTLPTACHQGSGQWQTLLCWSLLSYSCPLNEVTAPTRPP